MDEPGPPSAHPRKPCVAGGSWPPLPALQAAAGHPSPLCRQQLPVPPRLTYGRQGARHQVGGALIAKPKHHGAVQGRGEEGVLFQIRSAQLVASWRSNIMELRRGGGRGELCMKLSCTVGAEEQHATKTVHHGAAREQQHAESGGGVGCCSSGGDAGGISSS